MRSIRLVCIITDSLFYVTTILILQAGKKASDMAKGAVVETLRKWTTMVDIFQFLYQKVLSYFMLYFRIGTGS